MSTDVQEVFLFWLCLALSLIGIGSLLRLYRLVKNSRVSPDLQGETPPLNPEIEQAIMDLDCRTGHIWLQRNALALIALEEQYDIQFDRKLLRLYRDFGIPGIDRLLALRDHEDVAMMPSRMGASSNDSTED